jgi:hypothetical protein
MARKNTPKKKQTRSRSVARRKMRPTKKLANKAAIPKKRSAKKQGQRKAAVKTKAVAKKAIAVNRRGAPKRTVRRKRQTVDVVASSVEGSRAHPGGQPGDLQGLSNAARADSESIGELLEEGNTFEADAVAGVEQAVDADEAEVRTHEVPEADVPEEYLDKDEL